MMSRALTLTKVEVPRLTSVNVDQNGCLEGLTSIKPPFSEEEMIAAETALVAHLVELLCTFVGETLAVRLLQGVWPALTVDAEGSEREVEA